MIHNPYPIPTDEDEKASCRFATYIAARDRALLMSLRPVRGTPQAVVNNLIKHFCDELRELKLDFYHPDADDILTVLLERRRLDADQVSRLRRTTFGVSAEIPARLQHSGRGHEVRKRSTDHATKPRNLQGKANRRVKRTGTSDASTVAPSQDGSKETTVS